MSILYVSTFPWLVPVPRLPSTVSPLWCVGSRMYMCLAVVCHRHFWHSDQGLLHATAITWEWNEYWKISAQNTAPTRDWSHDFWSQVRFSPTEQYPYSTVQLMSKNNPSFKHGLLITYVCVYMTYYNLKGRTISPQCIPRMHYNIHKWNSKDEWLQKSALLIVSRRSSAIRRQRNFSCLVSGNILATLCDCFHTCFDLHAFIIIIIIYPLTTRAIGAPHCKHCTCRSAKHWWHVIKVVSADVDAWPQWSADIKRQSNRWWHWQMQSR